MSATRTKHRSSKLKSFFFFLSLALIFWVLTKFSQVSTSTVMANLVYTNAPAAVSVASDNLKEVSFDISANGFQFLSFQLKRPTVNIDISRYYETGDTVLILSQTEVAKIITSQLDNNTLVRNVNVDELGIGLDLLITKKVPVRFDSELDFKDGYRNLEIPKIQPDSVTISGPAQEVEETTEVFTAVFTGNSISENIQKKLKVRLPENSELHSTPEEVEVSIKVGEFTQKQLTVPVEVINIPEGVKLKLLPENISLSFNISVNDFNDVTENDFQVVCDFSSKISEENFMVPRIVKKPEGLHHLELSTKQIEYLIFK